MRFNYSYRITKQPASRELKVLKNIFQFLNFLLNYWNIYKKNFYTLLLYQLDAIQYITLTLQKKLFLYILGHVCLPPYKYTIPIQKIICEKRWHQTLQMSDKHKSNVFQHITLTNTISFPTHQCKMFLSYNIVLLLRYKLNVTFFWQKKMLWICVSYKCILRVKWAHKERLLFTCDSYTHIKLSLSSVAIYEILYYICI